MKTPMKAGIIGIGKISGIYLDNLTTKFKEFITIHAISDLIEERAKENAEKYQIPNIMDADALLADPEIEIVLNLTTPQHHFAICEQALLAGKHVYVEKPLSLNMEQANCLHALAKEKGVRIGGAPDTFLGAGLQTSRKLLEEGWIGKPVAACAYMMNHGHEHWHPNPEFYYKEGAGPMFDMGPYYLTALVHLLGPVKRLSGLTKTTFAERTILSEPLKGSTITVDVPTHVTGLLEFANGVAGTIVTSFDVWNHSMPFIEIYGTEGTLQVPDPNTFGGPVRLRRFREEGWSEIPLRYSYKENSRGLGISEMARSISLGEGHRAHGDLTRHVLEIMHAIHVSNATSSHVQLKTTCEQPSLLGDF